MDSVRMVIQSCRGGDEDVIHIDDNTSTHREKAELNVPEDLVHHCLKGTWGICKTKEHDPWFEKTIFSLKGGFFFVSCFNSNIVISPSYIKLGEDVCVLHLADKIGDERQGVSISNGKFVQLSVILYRSEFTIFLFDKEE